MPIGFNGAQELVRVTHVSDTGYRRTDLGPVQFVPLIGAEGWAESARAVLDPPGD